MTTPRMDIDIAKQIGDGGCNLENFFKIDFRDSSKYNYILYITI